MPRYYLDTCMFISYLGGTLEAQHGRDAANGMRDIVRRFDRGEIVVATSAITRIEVLPHKIGQAKADLFDAWMKRSNLAEIQVDHRVVTLARELRTTLKRAADGWNLPTPDAIHVASALTYELPILYSTDGRHILRLAGHALVGNLQISTPPPPSQPDLPHTTLRSRRRIELPGAEGHPS